MTIHILVRIASFQEKRHPAANPRLHFGLGAAAKVDRIEVVWPDGRKESFKAPSVDRIVTLTEGTGVAPDD
jgi:ASPIC and UnbV